MGKDFKGKRKVQVVSGSRRSPGYTIPRGKHITVHEGNGSGGRGAHGRFRRIPRHPSVLGDKELARFPRQRNPGGVSARECGSTTSTSRLIVARCCGGSRSRVQATPRSLWDKVSRNGSSGGGNERVVKQAGGKPATGGAAPSRDHEGFALGRVLDLRRLLPGDDEDPHGRFGPRAGGLSGRFEGNVIMGRLIPGGTGAARTKAMEFESDRSDRDRGSAHA